MMKRVFFDFDGTLADTSRGIINGYNYAFDKKGMAKASEEAIRENIGPPLKETLTALVPAASEGDINTLAALYREYYSSEGIYELEFFTGIREMLERLRRTAGVSILSSKPTVFIDNILKRYGYGKYFDTIDGISLGFDNKSKKERLKERIAGDGLDPSRCMVVGDRAEDMNAARYCGTEFIGVLFGFGDDDEFNGSVTVRCVGELSDLLMEWAEGRP